MIVQTCLPSMSTLQLKPLQPQQLDRPDLLAQHKPLAHRIRGGRGVVQGHLHLPLVVLFQKRGISLDVPVVRYPSSVRVVLRQVCLVNVGIFAEPS